MEVSRKVFLEMTNYLSATSTKSSRWITMLLCLICCSSLIAAFIVGISNNRLPLALCYIAAIAIILAFVHCWRKLKYFLILISVSMLGFVVFVVLHNAVYALGQMAANLIILSRLLEFIHAVFFIIAILVCPAGFLTGVVGSIVATITYFKKKRAQNKDA